MRECGRRPATSASPAAKAWTSKPMPVRGIRRRRAASARREIAPRRSASRAPDRPRRSRRRSPAARGDLGVVGRLVAGPGGMGVDGSARSGRPAGSAPGPAPSRGDRLAESSPARASVSTTGRTGTAPSCASSASSSRSMTAAGRKGRAASWISTRVGAVDARRGRCGPIPRASRRRRSGRGGRGPRSRRDRLPPGPAPITTWTRVDRGMVRDASTAWASSALAGDAAILLGHAAAGAAAAARRDQEGRLSSPSLAD